MEKADAEEIVTVPFEFYERQEDIDAENSVEIANITDQRRRRTRGRRKRIVRPKRRNVRQQCQSESTGQATPLAAETVRDLTKEVKQCGGSFELSSDGDEVSGNIVRSKTSPVVQSGGSFELVESDDEASITFTKTGEHTYARTTLSTIPEEVFDLESTVQQGDQPCEPGSGSIVSEENNVKLIDELNAEVGSVSQEGSKKTVVCPSTEAISEALDLVQAILPDDWLVLADTQGFHYLKFPSQGFMTVQREIFLEYDGAASVIVHCVRLEDDNEISSLHPEPVVFDRDHTEFCKKGLTLCWGMEQYTTCCGADFDGAKELWSEMPNTYIDVNPYLEKTYETTCRSKSCRRLIKKRLNSFRCSYCAYLLKRLKERQKSVSSDTLSAKTTNKNLTNAQARSKLTHLSKEVTSQRKKIHYLKTKLANLEKLLEGEGVDLEEDESAFFRNILEKSNLSEEQQIFMQQQYDYAQAKDPRAHRWHPSMIRWALKIKAHSTAGYEAMRDSGFVKLPHSRTLFDYSHVIDATVGLNKGLLKMVVDDIKEVEKRGDGEAVNQYHCLIFDEMHISQNLVYRKHDGALMGYTHLDEVDKELQQFNAYIEGKTEPPKLPLATAMLAFMVKGLTTNVKSVIAAYPTRDLTKTMIHARAWHVIEQCEGAGVKILVLVCDGSANNRAFFRLHTPLIRTESGIVYVTTNIFSEDGKRPLFFLADVAHLIKTIRNSFQKSREGSTPQFRTMEINGEKILWKTIVRLYFTFKGDTLREGFKLNAQNVFLTSYSVMKVKYAAQVLSQTVANILKELNWPNTKETIKFIEMMNKFFDVLNGAHSSQAIKQLKPNLAKYESPNDERFQWLLQDFWEDYILKWKQESQKLPLSATDIAKTMLPYQAIEGIELAIRSFIGSTRWLLTEGKAKFVMARAYSQDPLEQDFSRQRGAGGDNRSSNVQRFIRSQVDGALQGKLKSRRRKANIEDDLTSELSSKPLPKLPRRK